MANARTRFAALALMMLFIVGCGQPKPPQYGVELGMSLPGQRQQVWAVAPAINLSGEQVDPILQADLLYEVLGKVDGLKVIPVNRVVQVFDSLKITQVQNAKEARMVCRALGCDGLIVPTISIFDPYNPPKFGGALQLFLKGESTPTTGALDLNDLIRQGGPAVMPTLPRDGGFVQAVGMFDATDGSVRRALYAYARGRNGPASPFAADEWLLSMDRYCAFVYQAMLKELMASPRFREGLGLPAALASASEAPASGAASDGAKGAGRHRGGHERAGNDQDAIAQ
jgi:hypothetical protein